MKRRNYLKVTATAMVSPMFGSKAMGAKAKQPNLLFIFPDQMRREAM